MTAIPAMFRSFFFLTLFLALCASVPALAAQPADWALGMQEAASPTAHAIHKFHTLMMVIITVITLLVMFLLIYVMVRFRASANPVPSKVTHNHVLEVVWTLLPALIVFAIAFPSMKLLYYADRTEDAQMTLKITGYQWYWGYTYPDHGDVEFTSYMVPEKDLQPDQIRLLSVDNPIVLPIDTNIRLHITAADVLHAFAVPALGVKLDAVPGRLNETWTRIEKPGTYYGQCSELCGTGHGFMPIEIRAVTKDEFAAWVAEQGGTMPAPEDVGGEEAVTADVTPVGAAPADASDDEAVTQEAIEQAPAGAEADAPKNAIPLEEATESEKDLPVEEPVPAGDPVTPAKPDQDYKDLQQEQEQQSATE